MDGGRRPEQTKSNQGNSLLNETPQDSEPYARAYEVQRRAYRVWVHLYDAIYSWFLYFAHRETGRVASQLGTRLLEVGVGTGLMLRYYAPSTEVVGIDLSEEMLQRAKEKQARLPHVKSLQQMDACRLSFADDSFDVAVAPFTISVVPDPLSALDEMARVVRPGGTILIASRFGDESGFVAMLEALARPLFTAIGWGSLIRRSVIENWVNSRDDLELDEVRSLPPLKIFTLIRITRKG
ncbi:MAG: class I SAM-dependent methyltransferase [Rhodobiaceae bacterium]|nr:class I SAM-dependent methyltransferase [Rhodobiaceae bacterium]MCC0056598.1 class I SAM-dependent methyltransferase [Rhodobiaceae bacterium]